MDTNSDLLFSIIIPTYNSGKTIAQSIKSILNQSFTNYEILVMDGHSNDDTLSITSSFKSSKIKITSEPDNGIYDAMNKGIQRAKGKWLYFLGSDDTLYDETILQKVSEAIGLNPSSKIIFGDVFTSDNTIERFPNYGFIELLDRCICQQAIFYSRELFDNKLFSLNYKIAADWDFNMQVFTPKNHPLYLPQLMANYNLNGASGNWQQHPEYVNDFADKKKVITRYKGKQYLYFYYGWYYIKRYSLKIKHKLKWIFR
jgi:glycosyltransferase involved in cell wall biosynthesis